VHLNPSTSIWFELGAARHAILTKELPPHDDKKVAGAVEAYTNALRICPNKRDDITRRLQHLHLLPVANPGGGVSSSHAAAPRAAETTSNNNAPASAESSDAVVAKSEVLTSVEPSSMAAAPSSFHEIPSISTFTNSAAATVVSVISNVTVGEANAAAAAATDTHADTVAGAMSRVEGIVSGTGAVPFDSPAAQATLPATTPLVPLGGGGSAVGMEGAAMAEPPADVAETRRSAAIETAASEDEEDDDDEEEDDDDEEDEDMGEELGEDEEAF